jgi:hypothetical protein
MRRLRSCLASTGSGGRGSPSGPTTGLCRTLSAGRGTGKGGKPPGRRAKAQGPRHVPGSTVPRTETPRWRAERRRARSPRPRTPQVVRDQLPLAPAGAPFPSVVEGHTGKARFARRRDADGAWADFISAGGLDDGAVSAATLGRDQTHRVVLANARTHNLRRREAERRLRHASHLHGVWVPAFAGTTGSFGAATPPNTERRIAPLNPFDPVNPRLTAL